MGGRQHHAPPIERAGSFQCLLQLKVGRSMGAVRDVFGRKITIAYMRELSDEEAEMERRYTETSREAKVLQLERLQAELGINDDVPAARASLRMVA